jgi:hypothetical protein
LAAAFWVTLTKRSLPILYLTSTPGFTREYEVGPPKINQREGEELGARI